MVTTLGSVRVNEGKASRLWFEVDVNKQQVQLTPDTDELVVEQDKIYTRYTTLTTGEQIILNPLLSHALDANTLVTYSYQSSNPTKIAISSTGVITQVPPEETASATITITANDGVRTLDRIIEVSLTVSGASVINVLEGGAIGSVRKAITDIIESEIAGANPATQRTFYTTQDHSTPSYVRNPSVILNDNYLEAFTCISPWNSVGGTRRSGTAITKRHVVLATHYSYGIGTVVRFITSENTVVDKTVVQARAISFEGKTLDAYMVLLDSDLPESITPCKIFPSNYQDYLPAGTEIVGGYQSPYAAQGIPLLAVDQQERAIILDFYAELTWVHGLPEVAVWPPVNLDRLDFSETIIVGDSGNPVFVVLGGELLLLSTFHAAQAGPFYGGLVAELNAMIITLDTAQGVSTGYTVTEGDLSSYTDYS